MPEEPRVASDYSSDIVEISKSSLLELAVALKKYLDSLVLVGGWVPYFLLEKWRNKESDFKHVGSIDIDFVIDPIKISEEDYATIVELIMKRGYKPRKDRFGNLIHFSFEKYIKSNGKEHRMQVDFLSFEYNSRKRRHRKVQRDLFARTLHGAEIAFDHCFEHELEGNLLNNGEAKIKIKIADVVGCIALKGLVVGERYKEKDAYDIYSIIKNYKDGPKSVAEEFKPHLQNTIIQEALKNIKEKFEKESSAGVSWVVNFIAPIIESDKRRLQTDAFMQVSEFLKLLGVR